MRRMAFPPPLCILVLKRTLRPGAPLSPGLSGPPPDLVLSALRKSKGGKSGGQGSGKISTFGIFLGAALLNGVARFVQTLQEAGAVPLVERRRPPRYGSKIPEVG